MAIGPDDRFTVKDNQPALKADIALAFRPDAAAAEWSPQPGLRQAETIEKRHGRIETLRLEVSASIAEHLAPTWPGLAQVCRLTRQRIVGGKESMETVYAVTNLTAGKADPGALLNLSREHLRIENRLHYVRDVTYCEDQARTNAGYAPQVLAALRNTALTMLRRLGFKSVEGLEHFAEHRQRAIEAIFGRGTE